ALSYHRTAKKPNSSGNPAQNDRDIVFSSPLQSLFLKFFQTVSRSQIFLQNPVYFLPGHHIRQSIAAQKILIPFPDIILVDIGMDRHLFGRNTQTLRQRRLAKRDPLFLQKMTIGMFFMQGKYLPFPYQKSRTVAQIAYGHLLIFQTEDRRRGSHPLRLSFYRFLTDRLIHIKTHFFQKIPGAFRFRDLSSHFLPKLHRGQIGSHLFVFFSSHPVEDGKASQLAGVTVNRNCFFQSSVLFFQKFSVKVQIILIHFPYHATMADTGRNYFIHVSSYNPYLSYNFRFSFFFAELIAAAPMISVSTPSAASATPHTIRISPYVIFVSPFLLQPAFFF